MIRMDDSRINAAVGAELRAARARRGWSRDELADESGVSPVSIQRYEGGSRSVPVATLVRLITALGIDIAEIDRAIQRADDAHPKAERAQARASSANETQVDGAAGLREHQQRFQRKVKEDQRPAKRRA